MSGVFSGTVGVIETVRTVGGRLKKAGSSTFDLLGELVTMFGIPTGGVVVLATGAGLTMTGIW
jgi:hypothetical protein